jgi:hypothetical protein
VDIRGHVLEFLGGYRCGFEDHCPVAVPGRDLSPVWGYVESRYLGWLPHGVNQKAAPMTVWRHTIRGFTFVFGDAYVLFGVTTLDFVILNCGQEMKYECFAKKKKVSP